MTRQASQAALFLLLLAAAGSAHPMGNFSVSHYTRIEARPGGIAATYVLDLAELPTFELLQKWDLKQESARNLLEAKARAEAEEWTRNLRFRFSGKAIEAKLVDARLVMANGAGNLPIARITAHLELPGTGAGGVLEYEDTNYPERAGWKEIVVGGLQGVNLVEASHIDVERSKGLTEYPTDPAVAPPQDLRARLEWKVASPVAGAAPAIVPLTQPKAVTSVATAVPTTGARAVGGPPAPATPGEVVKGDPLSQLLSKGQLGWSTILVGLGLAFWFGCLHATTPGHGKTMVAAYLVGERGTPKHALFLGAMVTFTHTISVFALGVGVYFFAGSIAPEKISKVLAIVSGLSIVVIGLWLLYKRSMRLVAASAGRPSSHNHNHHHDHHHHDHEHGHTHEHVHAHAHAGSTAAPVALKIVHARHDPAAGHGHDHGEHPHHHGHGDEHHHGHHPDHGHHHGPGGHSHVPEGPISLGSLIALGASGGLVPCPSALVLLLSAVSIGRVGFGLALLVSFSLGLAGVLMAIGLAVLYAKQLLPKTERTMKHPIVKLIPVFSAGVIVVIGLAMTGTALGWIKIGSV